MQSLAVSALSPAGNTVEIVERKGLGHPDTICDALAETLSRNLCREYLRRFGEVLHYNVDKVLLCGGRSAPAFGGGAVLAPINIYLAGRAVNKVGNDAINIREIAIDGSRAWMRANLHALNADREVHIQEVIQPGSGDLQQLFSRRGGKVPLANDTSIGVGYAPMSPLELLVLAAEKRINGRDRNRDHPAWGEDIKVMGIRQGSLVNLTVACAMIGKHLAHIDDYLAEKAAIGDFVQELAAAHGFADCQAGINAADDPKAGIIYLTVTGTSAEAGDDGQVGRGNRVNGLITPCRPMSLEAAAGKNPVSHAGKIYNIVARRIAETLVATVPQVSAAHCLMVSRIGAPVTRPAIVEVRLTTRDQYPVAQLRQRVEEITADALNGIPGLIDDFMAGNIEVF
ncbi:MAG: methionine adenosyltransferase [Pseudomonadota bacterium]|jgi:S-adenosylmethionine synthetase